MNTENTTTNPESVTDGESPLHERSSSASWIGVTVVMGFVLGAAGLWFWSGGSEVKAKPVDPKNKKYTPLPIAKEGPYPKVEVDDTTFGFGSMEFGETGSHSYVVTNKGEGNLRLKQGPKSCACTRYEIEDKELKPGESTKIHVEWKPKNPEAVFQQAMNLYTNDPEQPVVTLQIGGHVAELLRFLPKKEWDLGNMADGNPGTASGVIASSLLKEVDLGEIKVSHPALTVKTSKAKAADMKSLDANDGVVLDVTLSPEIPAGPFRGALTFVVRGREYKIDLKAHRRGSIRFAGTPSLFWDKRKELIDLGQFKAKTGKKGTMMLYATGENKDALKVTEIKTTPSFMECSLEKDPGFPAGKTARYILTVELPPGAPAGGFVREQSGRIKIKTEHPEYPEINLRVTFVSLAN